MRWQDLKNASTDERDFYWWEREQEAITMRDTYARLGIADGWERKRIESRLKRGLRV